MTVEAEESVESIRRLPNGSPIPMEDSPEALAMAMARAGGSNQPPPMEPTPDLSVTLSSGVIMPSGELATDAQVRELNGYDEEALARLDVLKNPAKFLTELLLRGVDSIGGEKPNRAVFQEMLGGDRDALMLGIRRATYGDTLTFTLICPKCEESSDIVIELNKDIVVKPLADPTQHMFDIPLRRGGSAKIALLTGMALEMLSEASKKNQAEINTVVLQRCVASINEHEVFGSDEMVRNLSLADRDTIIDWISDNQPGPQLQKAIRVPCAICGNEFSIVLGILNLFRF